MSLRSQTQMINSTHDSFMADKKQTKYMAISFSSDNFQEDNEQSPTNKLKNENETNEVM